MPVVNILFQDNFERGADGLGDAGRYDSETDTENQLDIPHYVTLAQSPGLPMPYSGGAYCLRAVLSGGTADAFVTEADANTADGETWWHKWNMWISPDFATNSSADDTFVIWESIGAAVSFAVGLRYVDSTGLLEFGCGELTPTSFSGVMAPLGEWFTVEVSTLTVTGAATGAISVFITPENGTPSTTATVTVGSIQNVAATHCVLGPQDHLATTLGTMLFDNFMIETQRIWPQKNRFSQTIRMTQSGHVFVGPGTVEKIVSVNGTGTSNVIEMYDTDTGQIYMPNKKDHITLAVAGTTYSSTNTPFDVTRGLFYHDSDGTNVPGTWALGADPAETFITISRAPNWFSDGNIRRYAHRRNVNG